ncbi:MAG: SprT family zinc-dependent metalloprotease [Desulfonatronovibrio sp.]
MPSVMINVEDINVNVRFKKIKHVYLRVKPPDGKVLVSAPRHLKISDVRNFVIARLGWIVRQTGRIQARESAAPCEFLEGETHYVWGKRFFLALREKEQAPSVMLEHDKMVLTIRWGADQDKRRAVVEKWHRDQIRKAASDLIKKWEKIMGVEVKKLFVRRMKTRWGSCNFRKRTIRLNTSLSAKPLECLEYIIVHELTHLLEPSHNGRFKDLMAKFLPAWPHYKRMLEIRSRT